MGWLRKRFGEPSTHAGVSTIALVAASLAPPQYQLLIQGIAAILGVGAVAIPEVGNKG